MLEWLKEWSGIIALGFAFVNLLLNFGLTRWSQGQNATRDFVSAKAAEIRQLAGRIAEDPYVDPLQNTVALKEAMITLRDRALHLRGRGLRDDVARVLKQGRGLSWRVDDMHHAARRMNELQEQIDNATESSRQSNDLNIWRSEQVPQAAILQEYSRQIVEFADLLHRKLTTRDRYPFRLQSAVGASDEVRRRANRWLSRSPDELD
jgi:hypothetical protein